MKYSYFILLNSATGEKRSLKFREDVSYPDMYAQALKIFPEFDSYKAVSAEEYIEQYVEETNTAFTLIRANLTLLKGDIEELVKNHKGQLAFWQETCEFYRNIALKATEKV